MKFYKMDSLIACIKGDNMILAMPGTVKHCTKAKNQMHYDIMVKQPEATQDEFESLLKSNAIQFPTAVLVYSSLK